MLAIINATLVMRDHLIPDAAIVIEDGKIHSFGEMRSFQMPEGCDIIDAKGQFVGPGLVDIHCHAGDGVFFTQDAATAARHHLIHGTTTILPTLSAPDMFEISYASILIGGVLSPSASFKFITVLLIEILFSAFFSI